VTHFHILEERQSMNVGSFNDLQLFCLHFVRRFSVSHSLQTLRLSLPENKQCACWERTH